MKTINFVLFKKDYSDISDLNYLLPALRKVGYKTKVEYFKNKANWDKLDIVLLSACWDYHSQINNFLSFLKKLEYSKVRVLNPISIIRWNYHKKYLLDLEKMGASIVPTIILPRYSSLSINSIFDKTGSDEIIIKPAIGAGSSGIFKVKKRESKSRATKT